MTADSRTFMSPSGRTWTATVFAGGGAATTVLRFRSGDLVLDLADFPADWARLADAALVALARRGEAPRFAPPTPSAEAPRGQPDTPRGEGQETFADRMGIAFLSLQVRSVGPGPGAAGRIERVSPGAFASLVETRLRSAGKGRAVPPAEVVSWFAETLPDLTTVQAIAEVCGVDPGWLGFGSASRAPSPAPAAARASPQPGRDRATEGVPPAVHSP